MIKTIRFLGKNTFNDDSFFFVYSLLSRCSVCTVLLFDSTFDWSNKPSREEQNVKEGIHPKYATSCTEY